MSGDYASLQERLDTLLRQGNTAAVRREFERLKDSVVPRDRLADFANIARRSGLPEVALRLLQPIVRPPTQLERPADPRELAIYGAALSNIGAASEAMRLLKPITTSGVPEVWLYLAFAQIFVWEYPEASRSLKNYLRSPSLNPYSRAIGELNLAACYRFLEDDEKCETLVTKLLKTTRENQWTLLEFGALQLDAQLAIARGSWQEAERSLENAWTLAGSNEISRLYVNKWRTLLSMRRDGPTKAVHSKLEALRDEARAAKEWEALRECDYYEGLAAQDRSLILKVYFGTPYPPYKKRLMAKSKTWLELPTSFVYSIHSGSRPAVLDVPRGRAGGHDEALPADGVLHRLLHTLTSDFYKPFKVGELFIRLYPDEFFDPFSSPGRVHAVIKRLRHWLKDRDLPLRVDHDDHSYRLAAEGACELHFGSDKRKQKEQAPDERFQSLHEMRARWPDRYFSVSECATALELDVRDARTLLSWAVKEKHLRRTGEKRGVLYKFSKRESTGR